MTINNHHSIHINNIKMTDENQNEPQARAIPKQTSIAPVFNKDVGTANVAEHIDNSKGKIDNRHATIHDGQTNTTNVGGDSVEQFKEKLADAFEPLKEAAGPLPEGTSDVDAFEIPEYQDHPAAVYAATNSFVDRQVAGEEIPQEEQEKLEKSYTSMLAKYGEKAGSVLASTLPYVITAAETVSGAAFPYNLIINVGKKFVSDWSK